MGEQTRNILGKIAGRQTILSDKPDGRVNRLPVGLRQIGATGNLPLHADPKSVA
jgi:hypothetical protein